jgi:hypothetical protein
MVWASFLSLPFVTECGTLFSTKLSSFFKKVYRALWQTFISQEASFTRHNSQLKPIDLSVMAVTLRFVSISQPRRASFLDTLLLPVPVPVPVPALLQKIRTHPADAPTGPSGHHPRKSPRFIPGGPHAKARTRPRHELHIARAAHCRTPQGGGTGRAVPVRERGTNPSTLPARKYPHVVTFASRSAAPPPRHAARPAAGGGALRARAMAPDPCADLAVTPKTSAKDEASCSVAPPTPPKVTPDEVRAVARKFADQPIQETEPDVWAVLTAISKKARLRPQVPAPLPRPPLNPNPKTQALPIFLSFFVFA